MDDRNVRLDPHARWNATDQSPRCKRRGRKSRTGGHRCFSRAFSLLEMMIAVVILGLGLVMVATMFPIAWGRARNLVEYTSQAGITEATHTTVDILTRVPDAGATVGSFAGDLASLGGTTFPADTRVHVLHIENVLASEPRRIVPQRVDPWDEEFAPWKLEVPGGFARLGIDPDIECDPSRDPKSCYASFMASQVVFESRVYPPMRVRDPKTVDKDTGEFKDNRAWDDELDTRRYAWAVLHRLREIPANAEATRNFDLYYVTLRRPHATNRYARQNPEVVPDPLTPDVIVEPVALPPEEDVMFPSPWRVQILFPANPPSRLNPVLGNPETGLPSEIEVNIGLGATADFVVDMFRVRTPFIDEVTGQIYHVTRRRLTGDDLEEGILTLDREILTEDMDPNPVVLGVPDPDTWIRTVWVFPPPVQADRTGDDPVFEGNQPAVGIDVRALTISPRQQ